MDELSTGDRSGRPDTSGVDQELAASYARRMFEAVLFVRFGTCRALHLELNANPELYVVSLDLFRAMCKQRGMNSGKWREYAEET